MEPNPSRQLQFAIVGCGLIGKKRAAALKYLDNARLAAVADLNINKAQELAALNPGCEALDDPTGIFARPGIDAVIVCTINSALAPMSLAAVQAGKHVLVEKPGALNAGELYEIQRAAARSGAKVRIGYNHRYHPALQKARALIDGGGLGSLMFIRGRYGHGGRIGYDREWRADPGLSGGGELIDQGVHLIDLAGWYLGDFKSVGGHAKTCFWDMKVDDNAFLSLQTAANQTAWLHVSCTEWKNLFSLEIYGRNAKIAVDGLGGSYGLERLALYKMLPEMGPPETVIWEYPRGDTSWQLETGAFITDILLDRAPDPGLAEGIKTLEIVEKIYRDSGYIPSDRVVGVR